MSQDGHFSLSTTVHRRCERHGRQYLAAMARRFFANPLPPPGPATLSPRLGHHLGRIVRKRTGAAVVLFDGQGHEVHATVVEVQGRELQVHVGEPVEPPLGRAPRIVLDVACALPKRPRADWLFEHGTEAGIHTFRPIITERAGRLQDQHQRWERILIAACAQADRDRLPRIEATITLTELCELRTPAARFVATAATTELGAATTDAALLVVGPEGGFTEGEVEQLCEAGFTPRSLGPLTLRTETAVLAGATRLLQAPTRCGPDGESSDHPS